jgi:hypothetical protein
MHQYKTVAQILLILSIFNLVLAVPVVREIYDTHDDVVVPVEVRNVEVIMSKERRQPTSDGTTPPTSTPPSPDELTSHSTSLLPDGSTPSHSQLPLPDGSTQPTPSNPPPALPDGSTPLSAPPPNGEVSLDHGPTPSSGATSLAVSSPPGETESSDHSVPAPSEIVSSPGGTEAVPGVPAIVGPAPAHQVNAAATAARERMEAQLAAIENFCTFSKSVAKGVAVIGIAGGLVTYFRNRNHHRTIDGPDWCISNPSHLSCRRLCVLNHRRPDL